MIAAAAGVAPAPIRRGALVLALTLLLLAAPLYSSPARGDTPPASGPFTIGSEYLALGDSLATGVGSAKCPIGCAGRAGYVAAFARRLERAAGTTLSIRDLGVTGETTTSFIGDYFTNPESRSQLARAVAAIRDHGANIAPMTLDIGGNDALNVRGDGHAPDEKLAALATIRVNLETIVSMLQTELQAAGSPAELILLGYYEPYGDSDPDLWALGQLNQTILDIGAEHGLPVAEPYAAFVGVERQTTWISCRCIINIHPNDRGYALIAAALAAVTVASPPATASISGIVRDANGNPAAGRRVWYGGGSVRAGADGAYRIDDVPAGVALRFAAGDGPTGDETDASVTLAPAQTAILNFTLRAGDTGAVPDASGSTHGLAGFARIGRAIAKAAARSAAQSARERAAAEIGRARTGAADLGGKAASGVARLRQLPFP